MGIRLDLLISGYYYLQQEIIYTFEKKSISQKGNKSPTK